MRMEPLLFADENAPEWALQRSGQREKVYSRFTYVSYSNFTPLDILNADPCGRRL